MEAIAEFNDNDGLNVKLTSEKVYISAASGDETFALRSVNGVGTYDDIKKFAEESEEYANKGKKWKIAFFVMIFVSFASLMGVIEDPEAAMGLIICLALTFGFYYKWKNPTKGGPPVLDSYLKFMISGNERLFKFNKSDESSALIADFINKIEDTLTAYNK